MKLGMQHSVHFFTSKEEASSGVLGDGNCLFRSLSHQLTGTQDHHLILRKTITKFEQSYYGMLQQLHNTINRTPFSSHIKNMKKTCIWGTTVETRVLWNTYPVHCLLHEIMWDSAHSWRRLQVRQNTYFCTVDNGDCIAYNQASMNMDLLN